MIKLLFYRYVALLLSHGLVSLSAVLTMGLGTWDMDNIATGVFSALDLWYPQ